LLLQLLSTNEIIIFCTYEILGWVVVAVVIVCSTSTQLEKKVFEENKITTEANNNLIGMRSKYIFLFQILVCVNNVVGTSNNPYGNYPPPQYQQQQQYQDQNQRSSDPNRAQYPPPPPPPPPSQYGSPQHGTYGAVVPSPNYNPNQGVPPYGGGNNK